MDHFYRFRIVTMLLQSEFRKLSFFQKTPEAITMQWTSEKVYLEEQFDLEADLENAINEVEEPLFGSSKIYLEVKKKIGLKGKT